MPESVSINNKCRVFSFGLAKGWCSNCVVPFLVSWNSSREELSSTNYCFTPRSEAKGASQVVLVVKNLPANAGDIKDTCLIPWLGKIPWRRAWQPTLVLLPGESHGQRSLAGYRPWSRKESETTEATLYACTFKSSGFWWAFKGQGTEEQTSDIYLAYS